ncbi:hypothetical protein ACU8DI_12635 [Psychroserpens sp. BH13MA-6]
MNRTNKLRKYFARPFQFEGTQMHPNVLLMCKLLVILLCIHHFFFKIEDPFIPFIQELDKFHAYPNVFKFISRTLFVLFTMTLMFNIKVRTSAIVIGLIVLMTTLASKPMFYNHVVICGCALFLAGLTNHKQPPYLLIYQLSIVYLGAALNKSLDPDWWSGAFMDNWLGVARQNHLYLKTSQHFAEMSTAKFLSAVAISTEFLIGLLLLIKKTRNFAVWFIIIFHVGLFTLTSFRFGHFIESLIIILLAFLNFPKGQMIVHFNSKTMSGLKKFMTLLDVDKKQQWLPNTTENTHWLTLETNQNTYTNHEALKNLILYTPNFYTLLLFSDILIYCILYNERALLFQVNVIFAWIFILYLFPFHQIYKFRKHHL